VNFTALVRRFSMICLNLRSSPSYSPTSRRLRGELDAVALARPRTSVIALSIADFRLKRATVELHAARLDLREVEDVVDEAEEVLAESRMSLREFLLLVRHRPGHAGEHHFEKPMIALSGVAARATCSRGTRSCACSRPRAAGSSPGFR
jgi:hypothetical protein